jgi:hypothetical protein
LSEIIKKRLGEKYFKEGFILSKKKRTASGILCENDCNDCFDYDESNNKCNFWRKDD